jgi:Leucine-rich repeat (LRR) protein
MGIFVLWMIFTILGFSLQAQVLQSQNLTCNSDDLRALQGFMNGLESAIEGWNFSSTNCCNWVGITCNSSAFLGLNDSINSGRVVQLELPRRRLSGVILDSFASLTQLKTLNLSQNFLDGSIPSSLLHLPNLESLDLSYNELFGLFPTTTNLPSIRLLELSENLFTGPVPFSICQNSTRIHSLLLGVNFFSENLPPEIGNCTLLEHLCLGANKLSGSLPEEVFRLPKLGQLALQYNQFSGLLSSNIGNLSNLIRLDISMNSFSGNIPDSFHRLRRLEIFSAQTNNFSGLIPGSLLNSPSICSLSLRNNSLNGPMGLNCSAMVKLSNLDLGSNRFVEPIPDNLPSCLNLKTLNLARNNFSGEVPGSFRNFQSLTYLSLSNSSIYNLSSALDILQHCRNLTTLVLTLNFRNEEMPSNSTIHFRSLRALVIANCRLTGVFPQWLNGSRRLQLLDLSWNSLDGRIPAWLGNFSSLFYLDLSNNTFTGDIPQSLTGLQSLVTRNISLGDPSQDFPFFLKTNVSNRGLQYNQIISFPPTLELSNNFLTGPIWPEFGNLRGVHIFDLKCNNLSGNIPESLSGMTSVETLDLSHNNLSGTIPPSLVNLSFMSRFNVAYNNLTGPIPTGGQFRTFPNSSFEENLGLCGDHAAPCQSTVQIPTETARRSGQNKGTIIAMAVGIGFGTVLVLALILLIVIRSTVRKEVDPEKDGDEADKDLEELGSRLVVLFQKSESNKEVSIDDLLKSTNSFDQSNIVGCGGFGLVYKAAFPDGTNVAIKRLSGDCGQMEREFQAEVEALSRAQHPNLVLLKGYCIYKADRLLIYSYMENGSLDYWLHEKLDGLPLLDWDIRLHIAQGAARGLFYLHHSCEPHILHRDIKSSNILLDSNFEAHLADFGLARLILPYDTHVTTDLVGTLGYIPPEYGQASLATYKGDVYSFGVVLLELLTGKRPVDMCKPKGSRDMISWVLQMRRDKRETEVFDPFVYDKKHAKEMLWVLEIACICLSECPKARPCTEQLVSWLENIDPVGV